MPFLAFKGAGLHWDQTLCRFTLRPLYSPAWHIVIQRDMDAQCLGFGEYPGLTPCKVIPNPNHSCGFYGLKDASKIGGASIALDVEFSGPNGGVIVAEDGYRAEHQRLLSVHTPKCYYCSYSIGGPEPSLTVSAAFAELSVVILDGSGTRVVCDAHRYVMTGLARLVLPMQRVIDDLSDLPLADDWLHYQ